MVAGSLADLGRPAHCAEAQPVPDPAAEPVGRIILGSELAHRLHSRVANACRSGALFRGYRLGPQRLHLPRGRHLVAGISRIRRAPRLHQPGGRAPQGNARQSIFGVELRFTDPMQAVRIEPEVERRLGPEARVID